MENSWCSEDQVGEVRMNINDPIGDMITRIRNAHLRGKDTVDPKFKFKN